MEGCGRGIEISYDVSVDDILYFTSGLRYVYCDVAAYTLVGDRQAALLRVCDMGRNCGDS